ncbi:MAG: preprotein translocase subunit YajC [Flavobacteriales bacterium]|jgi:preprotein translocase subunit YajC|nr:preprotein translocase subunit YajC [Flavobacteriales bacterium]MDG2263490.1 preprotein translocase subunit YajC [Flavobacteriales bacterium]
MILLQAAGTGMSSLIMFGMIFAVMYFFMIRPQIKKQKKEREYRSALKKGDKVVTIGGIHGKINDVKEDTFIVEVMGGNTLKIEKTAVSMSGDAGIEQK